jgi:hypothetical protein
MFTCLICGCEITALIHDANEGVCRECAWDAEDTQYIGDVYMEEGDDGHYPDFDPGEYEPSDEGDGYGWDVEQGRWDE